MGETLTLAATDGQATGRGGDPSSPLALRGLTVSYGEKPALFSVDANCPAGAMSAIIGPNGAGKSVIAVHHDLSTVSAYFDHVFLVNVRAMAEGPVATTFTPAALAETYGGRLAATQLADLALTTG